MVTEWRIFCNFASDSEFDQKSIVKFIEVNEIAWLRKFFLLLKFDKFYRYEEELVENATSKDFLLVQTEGYRKIKRKANEEHNFVNGQIVFWKSICYEVMLLINVSNDWNKESQKQKRK